MEKLKPKTCKICGKSFLGKRGSRQCSHECNEVSYRTRLQKRYDLKRTKTLTRSISCTICGTNFVSKHNTELTCSISCSKLLTKQRECNRYRNNKESFFSNNAKRRSRLFKQTPLWDSELTDFIYEEAQRLRKLRNKSTGIEWHVDHIIPLKGKEVSGLHVWNNFAVIPKLDNLRKGNKNSLHAEWTTRLSA